MRHLVANPVGKRSVTNRIYSLTGISAVTLAIRFSSHGLRLALQIAANHFHKARLYRVAAAYESAAGWSGRHPG
jgi:Asp-tRNA(Asn)/Glu-tRNA(Gln) amidotransferase A subunit family amidase